MISHLSLPPTNCRDFSPPTPRDALQKRLTGVGHVVQGTDYDEVDYDEVYEKISAGGTK